MYLISCVKCHRHICGVLFLRDDHSRENYKNKTLTKNKRPEGPLSLTWVQWMHKKFDLAMEPKTRGPKGHISCTWVQCATFLTDRPFLFTQFSPKNTNLVEDVEILLTVRFVEFRSAVPVKFRWILFSGFRGEVKYVSANQKLGRPSSFSDQPEKHKFGRGHWDLASCQVLLNSVQQIQRRSRKCLSRSEARAAILFFRSARKTQTWERTLRSCFLSSFVEFCIAVLEEKLKMSKGPFTIGARSEATK